MNPINLKKNQELEVEIIDLSHEGLGVAKLRTIRCSLKMPCQANG